MENLTDGETDLRAGVSLWEAQNPEPSRVVLAAQEWRADVAIIGAGITGSLLAERLTREGRSVVILDRRAPQRGSTVASTAMLQWEIDAPMLELEQRFGFETAARICKRSFVSVRAIEALCRQFKLACHIAPREAFYLAGDELDAALLKEECALRQRAGLPSVWIDAGALAAEGLIAEAALRSQGAAEVDPVALARGVLACALARGATMLTGVEAQTYEPTVEGVTIACANGAIVRAKHLVLANGYELPDFAASKGHAIASTWALATTTDGPLWPTRALVWEASETYAYMRGSADGRIIIGGGDEDISDPAARDALTPQKIAFLREKLGALAPAAKGAEIEFSWAGLFGETEDSLPLIGRVQGAPHAFAAFGYGGNGITFSAMAADMIATALRGERDEDETLYALDRFG